MHKKRSSLLLDTLFLIAGCALIALALAAFTIPNNIAPGGLSGIATALSYLSGVPVGALTLALNAPLLLAAWYKMGLKPLIKTIVGTVLLSVLIDAFSFIPAYTGNGLLAALVGGVLLGAGMGLVLVRGISTGGTDLIGLMLHNRGRTLSMGQILMLLDTAVVVFAAFVFRDVETALYAVFTIAVQSRTIDAIQQGLDHAKIIYIVTARAPALVKRLAEEMGRGVTTLPARGGFSGGDKAMLMTVARRSEIAPTLIAVRALDPDAFMILSNAAAVYGEGFIPFHKND